MRIACLLVPKLPLVAILRSHPDLKGKPFVVTSSNTLQKEILAISPTAHRLGIRLFHTPEQASFHCPSLLTCRISEEESRSAKRALLDVALSFSPRSELAPPTRGHFTSEASVFMDVSNCQNFFKHEQSLAKALKEKSQDLGIPSLVIISGSRLVSLIVARDLAHTHSITTRIIIPGEDANALKHMPFALADPDQEISSRLTLLGFNVFGDLRNISRSAAIIRLGKHSQTLIDLAHGNTKEVTLSIPTASYFEESQDLDSAINTLETIGFALVDILNRLIQRLHSRHLACSDIDLEFLLESKNVHTRRIVVSRETKDTKVLLRLILLSLETKPLNGSISSIKLVTVGEKRQNHQPDLFQTTTPAPQILNTVIDKLEALCGAGNVGSPNLINSHRPDLCSLQNFGGSSTILSSQCKPTPAVRALRPPIPIQVYAPHGSPMRLRSAVGNGDVLKCAGPWRITGSWWSDKERFAFDYFDVWTEDDYILRIRRDFHMRKWEIDAIYD